MQFKYCFVFSLVVASVVAVPLDHDDDSEEDAAPSESPVFEEKLKKLYCSADEETLEKFVTCAVKLPEEVLAFEKECQEKAAPHVNNHEELRQQICDEHQEVGTTFFACIDEKKESDQEEHSDEYKTKLTEAVECLTDLL